MRNKNSEKWTEEVLNSMRGSKRVAPSQDLFANIQNEIDATKIRVLPLPQRIMGIAAAVLLLSLNIFAMDAYGFFENDRTSIVSSEATGTLELMSDFKIYE